MALTSFLLLPTTPSNLLLALLAIFLSYRFYVTLRTYLRLSHIPGPFWNSISIIPLVRWHVSGDTMKIYGRTAAAYDNKLCRIGPNNLLTSSATLFRSMNAPRSLFRRSNWFDAMRVKPGADNVLSMRDEGRHAVLRQKMAAGYSGKENPMLEASIDGRVADFLDLIERKYLSDGTVYKPMDLARKVQFFTLDVISELAFDQTFGDLRDDNDNFGYIYDVEANFPTMITMGVLPEVHGFLERSKILNLLAPSAKDKTGLGSIIAIAQEVVGKRYGDGKVDKQDMLGSFVRHGLTQEEAESESVLQILAGSDTTATGIRTIFLNTISNPTVHRKLMTEIEGGIVAGKISSPITNTEALQLPYLQAVIKEGLRICPPVTGLMDKEVAPEGTTVDGVFVPGGTKIGYCAMGIHHSKEMFGENADLFQPERWLLTTATPPGDCTSADKLQAMERNNELIFGFGRFQCLGKNVAFMELNKIFVEVFRRFNFSIANAEKPWDSYCAGIFLQRNMWVRVSRREESN